MTTERNRPMTVDDEINGALTILSETQPPSAMVSRVRQRLETAAISQRARSSRRLLIPAAGVVMAALALVAIFIPIRRTSETQAAAVETAKMVANTPLAQARIAPPSPSVAIKSSEVGKRWVQYSTEGHRRQGREIRHANNLLSYPLTRQEKLLLQFAHNAKPADLQALNPEYQARVEAQQDAEFAAYLESGSSSDTESATQTTESTQQ